MNSKRIQAIAFLAIALVALGLGVKLAIKTNAPEPVSEHTHVYQTPRVLNAFQLQAANGDVFKNEDLNGHWSLLFLGYLSCPDVCPMTMMKLTQILPELNETANNARVVFLSVDPQRDTGEKIGNYTQYFDDSIIGLRAEHKDLYPFVRNLGLMYSIPQLEVKENYFVDHSGSIVLLNPEGQIHAMFKPRVELGEVPTVDPDIILKDFQAIIKNAS